MTGDTGLKAPGANRQQSERTPSENKERAYVAASRRGDRSIEARVESAKAASKIHFERTGKRLKISEEIVRKEEMYEEEDDHLPLAYRNVVFRPDIPDKFRDYTMIQLGMRQFGADSDAMAKLDNEDRVNSAFAAAFPGMHGFGQAQQRQTDSMQVPLTSPGATTFQQAGIPMPNDWHSSSAMPPSTILSTAQSPGLAQFLPEMHRESSSSSNGMIRTPSDESLATMHRHGSLSSVRSARMERQGSGASMTSSLSHNTPIWPPLSPGNLEFDGFFGGSLSATTPVSGSHDMSQSRSMSVPFPTEPRGYRRRRDETTPVLQSPNHGMPLVSPNHSIPPAKRNRSDAAAYGNVNRYPFSTEVPGNIQGMVVQTPSAGQHATQSTAYQQAMAYGQFQQGLESQDSTKAVPRLQPPPRKIKSPNRAPKQSVSRAGNKENAAPMQAPEMDSTKKVKVEADKEQGLDTTAASFAAADAVSPTTVPKGLDDELSPKAVSKASVDDHGASDESYPFDTMGGFLGSFGGQDDAGWGLDFNTEEWSAAPVDAGAFSFDDLLQFPASQPDE
ncbi:hypothetical protein N0V93_008458 [Gnomoniopsis smithogilvyi]|uniref:Uncharacterized protein n=1 Tax=Gnomoniopsis smithogilvyi TaxID=1191159 RepID=A0A9W9CTP9_9PEZI|nr:hypothetical protein N0V93_008458 [Gnomoniopsis smithogilvyi]